MEENVALSSKKQKKFNKSITGIKKLLKKKSQEPKPDPVIDEVVKEEVVKDEEVKQKVTLKTKDGKKIKKWVRPKGLVYLSHIPHGFYEHQMTQYFRQFGVVTNARVIKSKKTGRSKGCAFVEFREPAVAQIVAETMNNYLMGKRLIKAFYVPPKKQRRNALRKFWNSQNNPASDLRREFKKKHNENRDDTEELKRAKKLLSNLNKTKKKLALLGIKYDIAPVDIPEELVKKENEEIRTEVDSKNKKPVKSEAVNKVEKPKAQTDTKTKVTEVLKKGKKDAAVKPQTQKEKEKSLKKAGVKPPEDFITVQQDDSDSSYDFDSDEYDKMLENEDAFNSNVSEGSDDSGDESKDHDEEGSSEETDESDEEIREEIISKKVKGLPAPPKGIKKKAKSDQQLSLPLLKLQKNIKVKNTKPQDIKKPKSKEEKTSVIPVTVMKRKAHQKTELSPKKPKFEKNNQKNVKKQFKKKKVGS